MCTSMVSLNLWFQLCLKNAEKNAEVQFQFIDVSSRILPELGDSIWQILQFEINWQMSVFILFQKYIALILL